MATITAAAAPALTTTFVPPESCLVSYSLFMYSSSEITCHPWGEPNVNIACFFLHLGPATSSSQCLPSSYVPAASFYYSPGICPSGYELACSSTVGSETQGTCCPSSYGCLGSPTTSWPWYSTDLCTTSIPSTVTFVVATSSPGVVGWNTTTFTGGGANAFGIPIRFKAADLASITSSSSTLNPTATQPAAAVAESAGLSAGAKAGIAVGVIVVVLMAVGALFWLMRRRRRQPTSTAAVDTNTMKQEKGANAMQRDKGDVQRYSNRGAQFRHASELESIGPHIELEGLSRRVDLSEDRRNIAELQ